MNIWKKDPGKKTVATQTNNSLTDPERVNAQKRERENLNREIFFAGSVGFWLALVSFFIVGIVFSQPLIGVVAALAVWVAYTIFGVKSNT